MVPLLSGITVVEASSFVAAPSAGLYLAQLGASVIRVDQVGGGPDFRRWPLAPSGGSLYWESLNRGKASVALELGQQEGRDLLTRLATAPGVDIFLTNFPVDGFLAHERLKALRPDLITIRVMGRPDGGPALDYSVNAALGFPLLTGPESLGDAPVNHVLPAWDLLTGAMAALATLAALRQRERTGQGQEVRLPLADVAVAAMANLGMVAEALVGTTPRPRLGNAVFGAFGRDFVAACGARLMILAITPRQWAGLVGVLGIERQVAALEAELHTSFARDEGERFRHREALFRIVESAVAARPLAELAPAFDAAGVCWERYRTVAEAAADPVLVAGNPLFSPVTQPSGEKVPVPGFPAQFTALERLPPRSAPVLGEDGEAVLSELLGLSAGDVRALRARGTLG
ncbi:CoA transferase [Thermaurantiacus sp.]